MSNKVPYTARRIKLEREWHFHPIKSPVSSTVMVLSQISLSRGLPDKLATYENINGNGKTLMNSR